MPTDVPEVDSGEAIAMREAGAEWIDVREPQEWVDARIDGTELIPLRQAVDEIPRRFPDKATQLVISCRVGARSGHLVAHLRAHGYLDVHNLRGGIEAWAADGRPVVTG